MVDLPDVAIPQTVLAAVNVMLRSKGGVEISSLDVADVNIDAESAISELTTTAREVMSEGWHWNTEKKLPLDPTEDGEIVLPLNCLEIDTVYASRNRDLVERARKLYDRDEHTFNIGEAVTVDMIVALDFEDLPAVARWYITIKAARRFTGDNLASVDAYQFKSADETAARAALERSDSRTDDNTMKTASPHIAKMRRR